MNRHERRAAAALKRHLPIITRSCGKCTACCTIMGVGEPLNKGFYETCVHEGDGCCNIYSTRPGGCRRFACQWLLGALDDDKRPDKLGIMFDMSAGGDLGKIPIALEVRQGASEEPAAAGVLWTLSKDQPILIVSPDGTKKLIGGTPGMSTKDIVLDTHIPSAF